MELSTTHQPDQCGSTQEMECPCILQAEPAEKSAAAQEMKCSSTLQRELVEPAEKGASWKILFVMFLKSNCFCRKLNLS